LEFGGQLFVIARHHERKAFALRGVLWSLSLGESFTPPPRLSALRDISKSCTGAAERVNEVVGSWDGQMFEKMAQFFLLHFQIILIAFVGRDF